jgi:hypothetical protein
MAIVRSFGPVQCPFKATSTTDTLSAEPILQSQPTIGDVAPNCSKVVLKPMSLAEILEELPKIDTRLRVGQSKPMQVTHDEITRLSRDERLGVEQNPRGP